MYRESLGDMGSEVKGNPHYFNAEQESSELLKIQLKQKVETLEDELSSAKSRVEEASKDELIDMGAAQQLVEDLSRDLAEAREEYEQKFGPETIH